MSDATKLLKFRRLLLSNDSTKALFYEINAHLGEQGLLMRAGTIVDATIITAPSSTKNEGESPAWERGEDVDEPGRGTGRGVEQGFRAGKRQALARAAHDHVPLRQRLGPVRRLG